MLARERLDARLWTPPWLRHQHEARYEWARQYCRGAIALDAACGTGYGSKRLAETAAGVVSLDVALEAVVEGRTSASLAAVVGDATRLPFRAGAFEVFVSFETIEHVRDDRAYAREARRVVKPGGTFLCSTPNRLLVNPGNTIGDRPFNPYHVREYTASELQSLLQSAFESVELFGQSGYGRRYAGLLGAIGRRWKMGGVRLHQLRKLTGIPLERRSRHLPAMPQPEQEPEVLIAVCR